MLCRWANLSHLPFHVLRMNENNWKSVSTTFSYKLFISGLFSAHRDCKAVKVHPIPQGWAGCSDGALPGLSSMLPQQPVQAGSSQCLQSMQPQHSTAGAQKAQQVPFPPPPPPSSAPRSCLHQLSRAALMWGKTVASPWCNSDFPSSLISSQTGVKRNMISGKKGIKMSV